MKKLGRIKYGKYYAKECLGFTRGKHRMAETRLYSYIGPILIESMGFSWNKRIKFPFLINEMFSNKWGLISSNKIDHFYVSLCEIEKWIEKGDLVYVENGGTEKILI